MPHDCLLNGHILGSINPIAGGTRKCNVCDKVVSADGTFEISSVDGSLERYPVGLFNGCEGGQIRKFLKFQKGDVMLHNWHDGCIYVFRLRRE